jgi:hypothetical protein
MKKGEDRKDQRGVDGKDIRFSVCGAMSCCTTRKEPTFSRSACDGIYIRSGTCLSGVAGLRSFWLIALKLAMSPVGIG